MRVHAYTSGAGTAITHADVAPNLTLKELIVIKEDELVYRVGDGLVIDIERTVVEIFGDQPGHVITHRCHTVTVTVGYAGRDLELEVHPAAHVKHVRERAIKALQLDAGSSADLVLRLPGATTDLVASHPIGSYVPAGGCCVTVDLVHIVRPQG
jgi:hypothetical protein